MGKCLGALERGPASPTSSAHQAPFPNLLNHLVGPILLISAMLGDQSAAKSQGFWSVWPGRAFVWEPDGWGWGVWPLCHGVGETPASCVSSAHTTLVRKSTFPPHTCLWVPPPTSDCLDLPCKIPSSLSCWAYLVRGRESGLKLGNSKCESLRGYCLRPR